jgi:hypothetical protein
MLNFTELQVGVMGIISYLITYLLVKLLTGYSLYRIKWTDQFTGKKHRYYMWYRETGEARYNTEHPKDVRKIFPR